MRWCSARGCTSSMRSRPVLARAAGLLDQEARSGWPRTAGAGGPACAGSLRVARIHEDAAAHQDAVHLGDQRGDPAHVEVLAARRRSRRPGIRRRSAAPAAPRSAVRRVDRELAASPPGCACRGCVSMNSPSSRSSVKPCMPWPTSAPASSTGRRSRSRRRPAAVPGCRKSAGVRICAGVAARAGPRRSCRPTTLTSMFDEPSSGSNSSRYLPRG